MDCVKYLEAFLWSLLDTPVGLILTDKFASPFVAFMAARCVCGKGGNFLPPGSCTSKMADLKYLMQMITYSKCVQESKSNQEDFPRYVILQSYLEWFLTVFEQDCR